MIAVDISSLPPLPLLEPLLKGVIGIITPVGAISDAT
jgi:hypothetical protein